MSRVLMLRHGRTAWNEEGRIQGRTDTPLSVAGRAQVSAWRLPAWANRAGWYASPLTRARETAMLLGQPAPRLDDRLVEMSFGAYEGRRLDELRLELGPAMAENEIRGLDFHPPDGETPREVAARFASFLAERAAHGGDLVVVAHKGILRAALVLTYAWDMLGRPPVPIRDDHGFLLTTDACGRATALASLPLRAGRGMTALIWVQHLLGTGHLRRAQAIAAALARSGLPAVLVSGGAPVPWPAPAGVRVVQLPPLRSSDAGFSALTDLAGRPPGAELWEARRRAIGAAVAAARPRVVLTEMFPFGRRAFRGEIEALLEGAAPFRPLVAASVRDVLVGKTIQARWDEMRDIALARYDLVLVHSDPRVMPFSLSFPHTAALHERLVYTGFVLGVATPMPADADLAVVVSAGGGAVGRSLLSTALAARQLSRLGDRPWLLVAGANLPEAEHAALVAAAPPGVSVTRHRDDLPDLLATADVSVSQAGYNTVVEGLAGRARLVLVPFDGPGQDEQLKRARRLTELGLASLVEPPELSPAALAGAIDHAAAAPRPDAGWIDLDGATHTAALLVRRMAAHVPSA